METWPRLCMLQKLVLKYCETETNRHWLYLLYSSQTCELLIFKRGITDECKHSIVIQLNSIWKSLLLIWHDMTSYYNKRTTEIQNKNKKIMMIYVHIRVLCRIKGITASLTVYGTQAAQVYFRFNYRSPKLKVIGKQKLNSSLKYTSSSPAQWRSLQLIDTLRPKQNSQHVLKI